MANDSKESVHWEPVLNKNRFSIPIPIAGYAVLFRTLAAESKWNMEALLATFQHGLSSCNKDELAAKDPVSDLESLIRLDKRLRERRCERQQGGRSSSRITADR